MELFKSRIASGGQRGQRPLRRGPLWKHHTGTTKRKDFTKLIPRHRSRWDGQYQNENAPRPSSILRSGKGDVFLLRGGVDNHIVLKCLFPKKSNGSLEDFPHSRFPRALAEVHRFRWVTRKSPLKVMGWPRPTKAGMHTAWTPKANTYCNEPWPVPASSGSSPICPSAWWRWRPAPLRNTGQGNRKPGTYCASYPSALCESLSLSKFHRKQNKTVRGLGILLVKQVRIKQVPLFLTGRLLWFHAKLALRFNRFFAELTAFPVEDDT